MCQLHCRNFQRMTGLRVTGRLDTATRTKMVAPRCGMPDMVPEGSLPKGVQMAPSKNNRRLRPENFYVPGENSIQQSFSASQSVPKFIQNPTYPSGNQFNSSDILVSRIKKTWNICLLCAKKSCSTLVIPKYCTKGLPFEKCQATICDGVPLTLQDQINNILHGLFAIMLYLSNIIRYIFHPQKIETHFLFCYSKGINGRRTGFRGSLPIIPQIWIMVHKGIRH